jgi:hypothetical protein
VTRKSALEQNLEIDLAILEKFWRSPRRSGDLRDVLETPKAAKQRRSMKTQELNTSETQPAASDQD